MSDLADNRRRQRELAEKLKMLKQEEALLMDILSLAERYEEANPSAEPEPVEQRSAAPRTRPTPTDKSRHALLGEVLIELLGAQDRPRSTKALCDELTERYPDRSLTRQVVRSILESLVAKGRVRRHKQERSVSYSLAERATH